MLLKFETLNLCGLTIMSFKQDMRALSQHVESHVMRCFEGLVDHADREAALKLNYQIRHVADEDDEDDRHIMRDDILFHIHENVQRVRKVLMVGAHGDDMPIETTLLPQRTLYNLLSSLGLGQRLVVSREYSMRTSLVIPYHDLQMYGPPEAAEKPKATSSREADHWDSSSSVKKMYDKMATALIIMMLRFKDCREFYSECLETLPCEV